MRMKNKKGFTLVELIVVLAILAILVVIAVPIAFGSLDASKKTVCVANRTTAKRMISQDEVLRGSLYTIPEIETFITNNEIVCPKGGKITTRRLRGELGMNAIVVACSQHVEGAFASRGVWLDFMRFMDDNSKITSNDELRAKFLAANGGKWPTITVGTSVYNIQPFYSDKGDKTLPLEERVWLYATTDNQSANQWFVPFVFNPATEKWYSATNYDGTGQGSSPINVPVDVFDLENIIATSTHSNGQKIWKELTEFKESAKE